MTNSLLQTIQMFRNAAHAIEPRNDIEEAARDFFCIKLARALGQMQSEQPEAFAEALDQFTEPEFIQQEIRRWAGRLAFGESKMTNAEQFKELAEKTGWSITQNEGRGSYKVETELGTIYGDTVEMILTQWDWVEKGRLGWLQAYQQLGMHDLAMRVLNHKPRGKIM
jgi:hypothetical protein